DFSQALTDCGEALRLDPQLVPARLVRGGALLRLGRHEEALGEFTEAITINPRYPKAYNDRGVAYSRMGRLEDAIADFTPAVQLTPDSPPPLGNRPSAHHLLPRHDLALQDFTRAVVLDTKYAAAYCMQRGALHLVHNQVSAAVADLTVALVLDPDNDAARALRDQAAQMRDQHFELQLPALPADVPAPQAREAAGARPPVRRSPPQP